MNRYIVGIDLGTTNSVVAYLDTEAGETPPLDILPIPQVTAPGTVESRPLLPSFMYVPADGEFPEGALNLPWSKKADVVTGEFARSRGPEVPARLVSSAKSWLSHAGTDRTAPILPWGSPDEVRKRSPVEVSSLFLLHIRQAWNETFPDELLEEQDVLLTVPASFDAVARDLTVRAAQEAGLPQVTLLEEPQAAFYAWIDANGDAWRENAHVGDLVLVCDVGGGTTDFSLIAVREDSGSLTLERIAVGNHILLGGDNMDLALAYSIREHLAGSGTKLDAWQFRGLTHSCRDAKESLLAAGDADSHSIAILGRGRKVIGGSLRTDVSRQQVEEILVDGFFPRCNLTDRPLSQVRTALQEIGLPYAADAAVTRHLAHFLSLHLPGKESDTGQPTAVLFNGGVMQATSLQRRLVDVLRNWFADGDGKDKGVRVLEGSDPEHAVARGAAYYGLARKGRGVRIRGGTARSYYVGIETAMPAVPGIRPPIKALCVVPRGLEEGTEVNLPDQEFGLVVGEPAEFRFLGSSTRTEDTTGIFVETWEEDIEELAPLEANLRWAGQEGQTIPVRLQARVNELGILELWCVSRDGEQRWKLEFNVRSPQ